jgi:hypothetical protein
MPSSMTGVPAAAGSAAWECELTNRAGCGDELVATAGAAEEVGVAVVLSGEAILAGDVHADAMPQTGSRSRCISGGGAEVIHRW